MPLQLGELYPPGSTVMFRVHDHTLGSGSSWEVKSKTKTNDVYVSQRESKRYMHASFHHSGVSHYTVSNSTKGSSANESTSHILQTIEKNLLAPNFQHAWQVIVPYSELSLSYVEKVSPREYVEIPIARGFDAVNLNLYLSNEDTAPIAIERALLVAELSLGGGGIARIVAQQHRHEAPVHETFRNLIEEARAGLVSQDIKGEARVVVVLNDERVVGTKYEMEIRLVLPE